MDTGSVSKRYTFKSGNSTDFIFSSLSMTSSLRKNYFLFPEKIVSDKNRALGGVGGERYVVQGSK